MSAFRLPGRLFAAPSLLVLLIALTGIVPAGAQDQKDSGTGRLPDDAVFRLGTDRFRQGGQVNAVVISPDGKTALSASTNSTMTQWELATGRRMRTCEGHQ